MNIEELKFILKQQKADDYSDFLARTLRSIDGPMLNKAWNNISELSKHRLSLVIGIERKDFATISMPKLHSGIMKPSLPNVCGGVKRALWELARVVDEITEEEDREQKQPAPLTCPHCGKEISVKVTVCKESP
jgi:hypothetical protein